MRYGERFYRDFEETTRWKSWRVRVETTDLYIRTCEDHPEMVKSLVDMIRNELRRHIARQDVFLTSFVPVPRLPGVHSVIEAMYAASELAGVGPMAAVAGAIAEEVGRELAGLSEEVIVENGGDIWLKITEPITLAIYGGNTAFSGRTGVLVQPHMTPAGICTSSGRLGHSFSFGRADAATIFAKDAALADAVATEMGNMIRDEDSLKDAIAYATGVPGVTGALALIGDRMAVQGNIELAPLTV
jgi:uncharacterized protein